jgi:hypothetical protein
MEISIMSKNEEDHKKWLGFAESKVKRLMKGLEAYDKRIGECLEFRPYPRSYKIANDQFTICEAFYIGIRVKGGVIPKKKVIDFSETRRVFFDLL